jgi:aldose 1-epimerase
MIPVKVFGDYQGHKIERATLRSDQAEVSLLSFGAVTQDWVINRRGAELRVLQGFASMAEYVTKSSSHGIIAGRVANRIANARFSLGGKTWHLTTKNPPHSLHGGLTGLGKRIWNLEPDSAANAVRLTYHSPDGEEGYPGTVDFTVTITLDGSKLTWVMEGQPDGPTPINLAQHNYYNLNGEGLCLDHVVEVDATHYTWTDDDLIPDGRILPVEGTRYDFRSPTPMRAIDPQMLGVDMNLVLREGRNPELAAATVKGDKTGVTLKLWTDQPGLQVYNSVMAKDGVTGLSGTRYGKFTGLCLEAQHFPDAVNHPNFPPIIATPDHPYRQVYAVDIRA